MITTPALSSPFLKRKWVKFYVHNTISGFVPIDMSYDDVLLWDHAKSAKLKPDSTKLPVLMLPRVKFKLQTLYFPDFYPLACHNPS